jgi:hypothetical protein
MYTTYRANVNELDISFINALKTMFKNKDIEIAICEATESSEDETSTLSRCFCLVVAVQRRDKACLVSTPYPSRLN